MWRAASPAPHWLHPARARVHLRDARPGTETAIGSSLSSACPLQGEKLVATRGSTLVGVGTLAGISVTLLAVLAATELWFDAPGPAKTPREQKTLDVRAGSKSERGPSWEDLGFEPAHVVDPDALTAEQWGERDVTGPPEGRNPVSEASELRVLVSGPARAADAGASAFSADTLVVTSDERLAANEQLEEAQGSRDPEDISNDAAAGDELALDDEEDDIEDDVEDEEPEQCGAATCAPGMVCCNPSCNICTVPGGYCNDRPCRMEVVQVGALCGLQSCPPGSVCCCNEVCIAPGQPCDPNRCAIDHSLKLTVPCGLMTLCNEGEVCCNPSCGTCVAPGGTCDQTLCP